MTRIGQIITDLTRADLSNQYHPRPISDWLSEFDVPENDFGHLRRVKSFTAIIFPPETSSTRH